MFTIKPPIHPVFPPKTRTVVMGFVSVIVGVAVGMHIVRWMRDRE
jgi:hypothetical protein